MSRLKEQGLREADAAAALEHSSNDAKAALVWAASCIDKGGAAAVFKAGSAKHAAARCVIPFSISEPRVLLQHSIQTSKKALVKCSVALPTRVQSKPSPYISTLP